VRQLVAQKLSRVEIARHLSIGRTSVRHPILVTQEERETVAMNRKPLLTDDESDTLDDHPIAQPDDGLHRLV
jgi:hypothetical protein